MAGISKYYRTKLFKKSTYEKIQFPKKIPSLKVPKIEHPVELCSLKK